MGDILGGCATEAQPSKIVVMRSEKLEFDNRDGERLAGRLEWPARPPRAFALFAHCFTCSKDIAAASRVSRALSDAGYAVLRFDFTGLGGSEGDFANTNFSSNVDDLVDAAAHLRAVHRAPALLVGHSLGGAAVLAAAARIDGVRAVATIGAPSDPKHVRHLLQDELSTIEARGVAGVRIAGRAFTIKKQFLDDLDEQRLGDRLRELRVPVLILHSPADEIVDVDHARRLYAALQHPKSFVSLDDADHLLSDRADAEYAAGVLAAWAARYVDASPPTDAADGSVVVEGSARGFEQTVVAGRHAWIADEPVAIGGGDTGPAPYDLLLAALGTCTSMTLGMYARHKKWDLEHVRVELRHWRTEEKGEGAARTDHIERRLTLRGALDDDQRDRLREIAERCPVHRTLEGDLRIHTALEERSRAGG